RRPVGNEYPEILFAFTLYGLEQAIFSSLACASAESVTSGRVTVVARATEARQSDAAPAMDSTHADFDIRLPLSNACISGGRPAPPWKLPRPTGPPSAECSSYAARRPLAKCFISYTEDVPARRASADNGNSIPPTWEANQLYTQHDSAVTKYVRNG